MATTERWQSEQAFHDRQARERSATFAEEPERLRFDDDAFWIELRKVAGRFGSRTVGIRYVPQPLHGGRFADPGGMGQEMPERDRRCRSVEADVGEQIDEPAVEREFSFINERHDGEPDHGLGDRSDALSHLRLHRP